jgi:LacI family transcriptional regulator
MVKAGGDRKERRRVAISLELEWGFKRHLEVFAGCQRYADEAGWDCSINPAADRLLDPESPGHVQYDGVLARVTRPLAEAAERLGVPVVNAWLNSPMRKLPSVFPDFEASGVMAAEHLLSRGFRRFGFLGFQREIDSRLQLNGFRRGIGPKGYPCTVHRFSQTGLEGKARGWEGFIAGLETWMDGWEAPIGIFVTSDLYCRYLFDVCRSRGLQVSQDVAIIGSSNELAICDAPPPTLTSIDLGYAQVGYRAAALLDRLMNGEAPPEGPELVAPAGLTPRQSTDSFAAEDPLLSRALRFIAEHSHERIEVKHVAAAVAINRRTLERGFRDSLGRSIAGEIMRLRLERAKRRMVETDVPLKRVAEESGFSNANQFYKTFTRVEGMPPSRYRKEHQRLFPERAD